MRTIACMVLSLALMYFVFAFSMWDWDCFLLIPELDSGTRFLILGCAILFLFFGFSIGLSFEDLEELPDE